MVQKIATQNSGDVPPVFFDAKGEPTLRDPDAAGFYADALRELVDSGIPFLLAGTYALSAYTGISRETKDIDIVCKAGDFARILTHFKDLGYEIQVEDDRWLDKVFSGRHFFDVIFASQNGTMPVTDVWLEHDLQIQLSGIPETVAGPSARSYTATRTAAS